MKLNSLCIVFCSLMLCVFASGQDAKKRVLFLGNSYTQVNDLPQMVAYMASSTGDTLCFDSNTPGGYTLQGHSTNAISLSKIAQGNWDFVVLQEQSQLPSLPISQVQVEVFPYARLLDSLITHQNSCAETIFYMTWGRKNGDASNCPTWPPVCTYLGMDSLLNLRYRMMADSNSAILSPVGAVWRYIRQNFPQIELYQSDESHPSVAGTYAAACSFYAAIFRKDPSLIAFNSTLSSVDAAAIRNAAKTVVFDHLMVWHIGEYDPVADFSYHVVFGNQVAFSNNSSNASNFYWDFGDGNTSNMVNPLNIYQVPGSYNVSLVAGECGLKDTVYETITIATTGVDASSGIHQGFVVYPNPATTHLFFNADNCSKLQFSIKTTAGQEVDRGVVGNSVNKINTSCLPDGIYFIQLFSDEKSIGCSKFIKTSL